MLYLKCTGRLFQRELGMPDKVNSTIVLRWWLEEAMLRFIWENVRPNISVGCTAEEELRASGVDPTTGAASVVVVLEAAAWLFQLARNASRLAFWAVVAALACLNARRPQFVGT